MYCEALVPMHAYNTHFYYCTVSVKMYAMTLYYSEGGVMGSCIAVTISCDIMTPPFATV